MSDQEPASVPAAGSRPLDDSAGLAPVSEAQRIDSLDVLRGFALLGILLMNIQSYSMPAIAYGNPTAYGDLTGANLAVWVFSHVFADLKFLTIFSALFGAGIVLMWQRSEMRGRSATALHYRRTLWLMVFGLAHAYLLWFGDILFAYGVCGLWVYWFKRRSPRTLIVVGMLLLLIAPVVAALMGSVVLTGPPEQLAEFQAVWRPSEERLAEIVADYQGGFADQMHTRAPDAMMLETMGLASLFLWRAGGLMLIGMALFRIGFLSAALSDAVYRRCLVAGALVGLPLVAFGIYQKFALDWGPAAAFFTTQYNYVGSLLISLAYAAGVMLLCKHGMVPRITAALANVGRMALTNYLGQSILATLIFYGHGLGYFGEVSRVGQLFIVFAIWAVEIAFSAWWLARFRFGPFEWLWRTLSYMRVQPMTRRLAPRPA